MMSRSDGVDLVLGKTGLKLASFRTRVGPSGDREGWVHLPGAKFHWGGDFQDGILGRGWGSASTDSGGQSDHLLRQGVINDTRSTEPLCRLNVRVTRGGTLAWFEQDGKETTPVTTDSAVKRNTLQVPFPEGATSARYGLALYDEQAHSGPMPQSLVAWSSSSTGIGLALTLEDYS